MNLWKILQDRSKTNVFVPNFVKEEKRKKRSFVFFFFKRRKTNIIIPQLSKICHCYSPVMMGDPSVVTGAMSYLMDQSCGKPCQSVGVRRWPAVTLPPPTGPLVSLSQGHGDKGEGRGVAVAWPHMWVLHTLIVRWSAEEDTRPFGCDLNSKFFPYYCWRAFNQES